MESLGESFNWVDLLIGVALTATLLVGLGLGFYRQVAVAGSLVAGLFLAGQFTNGFASSDLMAPLAQHTSGGTTRMTAYLLLFLLPLLLAIGSFFIFPRVFGSVLRSFDTVLGGVVGLVSAVLLLWLVLLGSSQLDDNWLEEPVQESYLGSRLARGAVVVAKIFPDDFRERVEQSFRAQLDPILDDGRLLDPHLTDPTIEDAPSPTAPTQE